jgi:flavin prenyltransferase
LRLRRYRSNVKRSCAAKVRALEHEANYALITNWALIYGEVNESVAGECNAVVFFGIGVRKLEAVIMHLTVAITGASGAIFGRELLRALEADSRVARVHFIASENSLRVLAEELGVSGRIHLVKKLLSAAPVKTVQLADADIGAAIASGSHPSNGMIILPCSMGTLAAIANGLANSLIARAADVTLKERRPLILCVRETPFNRIHLRNMTLAAEAGATIFPCIPAFYNQPQDSTEMARQFVYRVLAHIGLPQPGAYVWKPEE